MTATAVVMAAEHVQEIGIELLYIAPEETRRSINQEALEDLAESIHVSGVIEPILARPVAKRFEIVAGQRRFLASQKAGKKTCPCIVREMSDLEAQEIRTVSNLQREDLSPLDEARGFELLMRRPGTTVESVAARLGKSASFVARRLRLLDAIEPVRLALEAGAIEVGHALELARLDAAQQSHGLDWLNCGYYARVQAAQTEPGTCRICECTEEDPCELEGEDGRTNSTQCTWADDTQTLCSNPDCIEAVQLNFHPTSITLGNLKRWIANSSLRVLSSAPWPLDAAIAPMPCTDCPKRSANAQLLFDDCAQDTCTDRECFDGKARAWVRHELEAAETEKRKLLMLSSNYSDYVSDRKILATYNVRLIEQPCEQAEEAIYVGGAETGRRQWICRSAKCITHKGDGRFGSNASGSRPSSSSSPAAKKEDDAKLQEKLKVVNDYRMRLFRAVFAAAKPMTYIQVGPLLTEIAMKAFGDLDPSCVRLAEVLGIKAAWLAVGESNEKKLRKWLEDLPLADRLMAALLAFYEDDITVGAYGLPHVGKTELDIERVARLAKLDLTVILDKPTQPTKSSPGQAAAVKKVPPKGTTAAAAKKSAAKKSTAKPAKKVGKKAAKKATKKGGR